MLAGAVTNPLMWLPRWDLPIKTIWGDWVSAVLTASLLALPTVRAANLQTFLQNNEHIRGSNKGATCGVDTLSVVRILSPPLRRGRPIFSC